MTSQRISARKAKMPQGQVNPPFVNKEQIADARTDEVFSTADTGSVKRPTCIYVWQLVGVG